MVHVLVDGVAAVEHIVLAGVVVGVVVNHAHGLTLVVGHDLACLAEHVGRGMPCTDEVGALLRRHGGERLILVFIDAFVAETVDGAEGVVELHALEDFAVLVVELGVERLQHGLVHRQDLVAVVAEGEVEVGEELAFADEFVRLQVELPSDIGHRAHVAVGEGVVACAGGYADVLHEHIAAFAVVPFGLQAQAVVEEREVESDIPCGGGLPLKVGQADVVGLHGTHVEIAWCTAVDALVEVVAVGLVTDLSPAASQGEHGEPAAGGLHPFLVDDIPSERGGGEVAPAAVGTELGGAIDAQRHVEHIAALVGVVRGEGVVHRSPLAEGAVHACDLAASGG